MVTVNNSSDEDVEELIEAIQDLEPYVEHANYCLSRRSTHFRDEVCTCNIDDKVEAVDQAVQNLTN